MREPVTAILSKALHTFPPTVRLFRVFQCNKLYFETLQYLATGCVVMLVLEMPMVPRPGWVNCCHVFMSSGGVWCASALHSLHVWAKLVVVT